MRRASRRALCPHPRHDALGRALRAAREAVRNCAHAGSALRGMPRAGVRGGRGALSPEGHRQKCDLSAISAPESASSLLVPSLVTPTKFMRSTCVRLSAAASACSAVASCRRSGRPRVRLSALRLAKRSHCFSRLWALRAIGGFERGGTAVPRAGVGVQLSSAQGSPYPRESAPGGRRWWGGISPLF
jgi:hypothetical protein